MFQSTFHSIKIQHSFLKIIKKIFGSKGLFPRRANCGQGSGSFIGPRKNGSQSLPSASEGPGENGYWYYRNYINAVYWPFLLGLMNYLLDATSIAPYYFYCQMAKFFPINNSIWHHVWFCTIGILMMDFCCASHVDTNDTTRVSWTQREVVSRLQNVCNGFRNLRDDGVAYTEIRALQVVEALKHVVWWGISTPTTCCYQYVFQESTGTMNIEVYQWFMCPGLGVTYRVRNYWVHIMLAGLFQHCTSTPIYIVDDKAYFGKCPHVTMFAWGSGWLRWNHTMKLHCLDQIVKFRHVTECVDCIENSDWEKAFLRDKYSLVVLAAM